MPTMLRILLIVSSLLTVGYILSRIHKAKMRIQDSIFWIIFALIAVLLAIFPQIVYWMTSMLGIESPVNFVYLVFIFLAYKLKALSILCIWSSSSWHISSCFPPSQRFQRWKTS